ncbi:MAG: nucleotidyltransferase [Clostridiales bacterium]|jgi:dTDP-glucose pyrophosphorylase|nr:nucleotidyltransferase [Clostridiales bacterium]
MKLALVIMAAGMGRRFGGLKQVEGVGPRGELIMDYSVYDAIRAGFDKVTFVIRKEHENIFDEKINNGIKRHIETEYAFQDADGPSSGFSQPPGREKPWGTAHAVLCCENAVKTPFAVINADDFYGASSFAILADELKKNGRFQGDAKRFCMLGFEPEKTVSAFGHVARGVCDIDENGYLKKIVERPMVKRFDNGVKYSDDGETWRHLPKDVVVSMNMWGFGPRIFPELRGMFDSFLAKMKNPAVDEFFLPSAVSEMMDNGRAVVKVLRSLERWWGVTYKEDAPAVKNAIKELVANGIYPERLWKTV